MRPVFKEYNQGQAVLFPERLDTYIPDNHPVRIISKVVDKLNIQPILERYKGGGTSSYHPRMMLKILFYAYLNNIYSSRKIAQALKENIYFMWLSGKQFPDFRTINNFRSKRLKGIIHQLFKEVVLLLAELGVIDISSVIYTDGTKIRANASKNSFIWRKSIEKYKSGLESKLDTIIKEIELEIEKDKESGEQEEKEQEIIDIDNLEKKIEELNQRIEESSRIERKKKEKLKKKLSKVKQEDLPRLSKYKKQLEIIGEKRNSCSKTDNDATFMRMKEDRLGNRELKPGYNVQISTQNRVILHYSIHQNRTDTNTYIPHLRGYEQLYSTYPSVAVADAGYGSFENYKFLQEHQIDIYVKYNYFHKSKEKKFKLDIKRVENMYYNEQEDYFVCAMGQHLYPVKRIKRRTDYGYEYEEVIYQAQNCFGCPLRGVCHKGKGNRKIRVNHQLRRLRQLADSNLMSEKGLKYRKNRSVEPENVFGNIKQNKKFRRFLLRGLEKVDIEFGLIAISHNLEKLISFLVKEPDIYKAFIKLLGKDNIILFIFLLQINLNRKEYMKKRKFF